MAGTSIPAAAAPPLVLPITGSLVVAGSPVQGAAVQLLQLLTGPVAGAVVDSVTKAPVAGVVVTARDEVDRTIVYGRDTTNARGVFVITGLTRDEYSLRLNGLRVGYENGYRACDRTVLPWLDACTLAPGKTGRTLIDQL